MEPTILEATSLKLGDVVLCYSPDMRGQRSGLENGYSHAAICIEDSGLLEAAAGGVRSTSVELLLEEYGHLAILRNDELWDVPRLELLKQFALASKGKVFNNSGLKKYEVNRREYQDSAMERVHGHFAGRRLLVSPEKESYFCSELVTSAFISVGIIDESAATLFIPDTFLPEDIGRDKVFGFFVGYMVAYNGYEIPAHDMFRFAV